MSDVREPASRPCGSCPYRRDVPSGVWDGSEYAKLPGYDNEMAAQPLGLFLCHQQDGRLCAGWVGCHDMDENLALRFAAPRMDPEVLDAVLDYTTEVPLFESGAEAAAHGLAEVADPSPAARRKVAALIKKGVAR